jgi:hypothetical protein
MLDYLKAALGMAVLMLALSNIIAHWAGVAGWWYDFNWLAVVFGAVAGVAALRWAEWRDARLGH